MTMLCDPCFTDRKIVPGQPALADVKPATWTITVPGMTVRHGAVMACDDHIVRVMRDLVAEGDRINAFIWRERTEAQTPDANEKVGG